VTQLTSSLFLLFYFLDFMANMGWTTMMSPIMVPGPNILIKLERETAPGTCPQDLIDIAYKNEWAIHRGEVQSRFQLSKPVLRKHSLLQEHIQLRRTHNSAAFQKVSITLKAGRANFVVRERWGGGGLCWEGKSMKG
jgi:hypothetical protein